MNTQVKTAELMDTGRAERGESIHLPAGAGIALAVLIGSVLWIGIFAIMM
jgi:hypothetical protein